MLRSSGRDAAPFYTDALLLGSSINPATPAGQSMAFSQAAGYLTAPGGEMLGSAIGSAASRVISKVFTPAAETVSEATTAISPFRYTQPGETFYHYGYAEQSASFANGMRVGSSYGTTVQGLSGAEAQSGLALPLRAQPNAVYTITPTPGTPIRVNPITQPAYGRPGGLPEVQFYMGTQPGTVSGPVRIP